jgi:mono/diheme cytochrome c family protein
MQKPFFLLHILKWSLFIFLIACQNKENSTETTTDFSGMDLRTKQYMVEGQRLYNVHCGNCHMADGKGLANLIPPLANSDFMLSDIDRTICLMKYGISGAIKVNGQEYNHPMPANKTLTHLELAEISTYIYNSWGNKKGIINIGMVREALQYCDSIK